MDMLDDDGDDDLVPVKDDYQQAAAAAAAAGVSVSSVAGGIMDAEHVFNQQRAVVAKLTREELEDRYLRLLEENVVLKKHACKQEDKIKKLATKLIRVLSDKKRLEMSSGGVPARHRDVETEELIEDQQHKIRELERQVTHLKEKLLVAKQQLLGPQGSQAGVRHPPHTPGLKRAKGQSAAGVAQVASHRSSVGGMVSPMSPVQISAPGQPPPQLLSQQAQRLLEEARNENRMLEEAVNTLKEQVNIFGQENEQLREEQRIRESNHEDEAQMLKAQILDAQRHTATENIQLIQLHKENNHKSAQLSTLKAQVEGLEDQCRQLRVECETAQREAKDLSSQVQDEQKKSIGLSQELSKNASSKQALAEMEEKARDLQKENSILRESNNKLLDSAYDLERERQFHASENALKVQVAQLEATLKSDLGEKKMIQDALVKEREQYAKMEAEFQDLQAKYFTLKESSEGQEEKLKYFAGENNADAKELEEALLLLRSRKDIAKSAQLPSFLEGETNGVDSGDRNALGIVEKKDLKAQLSELQVQYVDAISELDKTRSLLRVQGDINEELKKEAEALQRRVEQVKTEYQGQLTEYRKLLEMRAARIQKLEAQLRDTAYGNLRKHVDFGASTSSFSSSSAAVLQGHREAATSVHNASGQSLFEIHIQKVTLTQEALLSLGVPQPKLFAAWSFYDHQMQYTPMALGPEAVFDSSAYYKVRLDDSFLDYVSSSSADGGSAIQFDVHHVVSNDCELFGAASVSLAEIIEFPTNKLHGSVMLYSAKNKDRVVGTMDYWFKLHTAATSRISQWAEHKKEVERMLLAAATAKKVAAAAVVTEAELMAGEERAMLLEEQKKLQQKTKPVVRAKEPVSEPPPVAITRELERKLSTRRKKPGPQEGNDHTREHGTSPGPTPPLKAPRDLEPVKEVRSAEPKPVPRKREAPSSEAAKYASPEVDSKPPSRRSAPLAKEASIRQVKSPASSSSSSASTTSATSSEDDARKNRTATKRQQPVKLEAEQLKPEPPKRQVPPLRKVTPTKKEDTESEESESESEFESESEEEPEPEKVSKPAPPKPKARSTGNMSKEEKKKDEEKESRPPSNLSRSKSRESTRSTKSSKATLEKSTTKSEESKVSEEKSEKTEPSESAAAPPPPKKKGLLRMLSSKFKLTKDDDDSGEKAADKKEEKKKEEEKEKESMKTVKEESPSERTGSESSEDGDGDSEEEDESSEPEDSDDDDDIVETPSGKGASGPRKVAEIRSSSGGITDLASTSQDSEGMVVVGRKSSPRRGSIVGTDALSITVTGFKCTNKAARFLTDDSVSKLYVAYKFLDGIYETPFNLPKPKAGESILFNFTKIIPIDAKARRSLTKMLSVESGERRSSVILFTVVSEPSENDGACVDIGAAEIDLAGIARSGADIEDCDIDVYDLDAAEESDADSFTADTPIGTLTISIAAREVFKTLRLG